VDARGVYLDVGAGEEVIRRWDADRFFYIVLTGRYDVFIDTRLIRSHGPGDHFGELAARDWGGGYGYARLATVRCAEPGRLLKLTTEDLAWLVDSQPAVRARIAATRPNACGTASGFAGGCPGPFGRVRTVRARAPAAG
jgi:CRP-like cAMP-binding protein